MALVPSVKSLSVVADFVDNEVGNNHFWSNLINAHTKLCYLLRSTWIICKSIMCKQAS